MEYTLEYPDVAPERIDKYINTQISELSRSYIQQLIQNNMIKVNNKDCKANYKCKVGDLYVYMQAPNERAQNEK